MTEQETGVLFPVPDPDKKHSFRLKQFPVWRKYRPVRMYSRRTQESGVSIQLMNSVRVAYSVSDSAALARNERLSKGAYNPHPTDSDS